MFHSDVFARVVPSAQTVPGAQQVFSRYWLREGRRKRCGTSGISAGCSVLGEADEGVPCLELGTQESSGENYLFDELLLGIDPTDVPAQMGNDTCTKLFRR